MRLLITGGTGFVGRATVAEANRRAIETAVLVRNQSIALQPQVKSFNLGSQPWCEVDIAAVLRSFRPDSILHLAGGAAYSDLEQLYEANLFLSQRLINAAVRTVPDARIVVAGSAAEYGPPCGSDGCSSERDPARPINAYGIAKLAQTLHAVLAANGGQSIIAARLFNPVGAGMPGGLAFADFARQIASGSTQLVTGNIDTQRDFMPVREAARILLDLFEHEEPVGRIVNVCSGKPQPVRRGVDHLLSRARTAVDLTERTDDMRGGVQTIYGGTDLLRSIGIRPADCNLDAALDELLDSVSDI